MVMGPGYFLAYILDFMVTEINVKALEQALWYIGYGIIMCLIFKTLIIAGYPSEKLSVKTRRNYNISRYFTSLK